MQHASDLNACFAEILIRMKSMERKMDLLERVVLHLPQDLSTAQNPTPQNPLQLARSRSPHRRGRSGPPDPRQLSFGFGEETRREEL